MLSWQTFICIPILMALPTVTTLITAMTMCTPMLTVLLTATHILMDQVVATEMGTTAMAMIITMTTIAVLPSNVRNTEKRRNKLESKGRKIRSPRKTKTAPSYTSNRPIITELQFWFCAQHKLPPFRANCYV